ncbi:DUF1801 domain-containing protein [Christiangramia salexigens]|uniref:YdhG-like domain-containing protein n=1 Tax=Christiangramia salexigens TaxID=1913577 RepID=A0A1L3J468_9FLAO|nr:DUF1801 domain-containing protein [Christiangramia salexigens]APG59925.1 hypothetical protein LPB144_05645 [Christiangramia salexigens]
MKIDAASPNEYISQLPEDRKTVISKLRQIILDNIPNGFEETMSYGMIGYVIPHSTYPAGYHCDSKLPLPFLNLASQKNYIAIYHSGIYADKGLHDWFVEEFIKETGKKPDMGKSCIRFKDLNKIPYELIKSLVGKISPQEWIRMYESRGSRS